MHLDTCRLMRNWREVVEKDCQACKSGRRRMLLIIVDGGS